LCWQTACLSHSHENGQLLPGATSATEAESAELDKIHDEVTPNASWDEFNKLYASFKSASDRTKACVNALQSAANDFKIQVTNCMTRIANASREDDNESNMSPEEYEFIKNVRAQLGLN
jgi:predicted  nucleic acid-binding Zn-ribbon protein